ncbi:MAG: hypothetical protein WCW01_05030 [Gammaproteobacteria bacterium]
MSTTAPAPVTPRTTLASVTERAKEQLAKIDEALLQYTNMEAHLATMLEEYLPREKDAKQSLETLKKGVEETLKALKKQQEALQKAIKPGATVADTVVNDATSILTKNDNYVALARMDASAFLAFLYEIQGKGKGDYSTPYEISAEAYNRRIEFFERARAEVLASGETNPEKQLEALFEKIKEPLYMTDSDVSKFTKELLEINKAKSLFEKEKFEPYLDLMPIWNESEKGKFLLYNDLIYIYKIREFDYKVKDIISALYKHHCIPSACTFDERKELYDLINANKDTGPEKLSDIINGWLRDHQSPLLIDTIEIKPNPSDKDLYSVTLTTTSNPSAAMTADNLRIQGYKTFVARVFHKNGDPAKYDPEVMKEALKDSQFLGMMKGAQITTETLNPTTPTALPVKHEKDLWDSAKGVPTPIDSNEHVTELKFKDVKLDYKKHEVSLDGEFTLESIRDYVEFNLRMGNKIELDKISVDQLNGHKEKDLLPAGISEEIQKKLTGGQLLLLYMEAAGVYFSYKKGVASIPDGLSENERQTVLDAIRKDLSSSSTVHAVFPGAPAAAATTAITGAPPPPPPSGTSHASRLSVDDEDDVFEPPSTSSSGNGPLAPPPPPLPRDVVSPTTSSVTATTKAKRPSTQASPLDSFVTRKWIRGSSSATSRSETPRSTSAAASRAPSPLVPPSRSSSGGITLGEERSFPFSETDEATSPPIANPAPGTLNIGESMKAAMSSDMSKVDMSKVGREPIPPRGGLLAPSGTRSCILSAASSSSSSSSSTTSTPPPPPPPVTPPPPPPAPAADSSSTATRPLSWPNTVTPATTTLTPRGIN